MTAKEKRLRIKLVDCCEDCDRLAMTYVHHLKTHPEARLLMVEMHWPHGQRKEQQEQAP